MAAPIPKGQSNTYGTPAPIAVPEAKNATAQPLKAPASAAFMPAPAMPGFSARTSTAPGAIQPSAPPIPQAVPQAPPGSPPAAPAAPAAPAKPSQAPLPPTAPKGAPVAPKTPPVAPAPSTGFVSTDPEIQRRIAEMQKQVIAKSSETEVQKKIAEMQRQAIAQSSLAAVRKLNEPYLTADSKATIESGFSPSQTGIVTTKGYTTARNELDSAIRTTESNPIDQVTSETEKMLSGIIKSNTDEYNRLTGLAGEFDAENNPTFQLLLKRQTRIAARMEEAIQNIQAQTDVDLRAQEKLNKDLEGKARAALNAAGQVGSMVGEGYMAAQMQNNLDALQSIKAAAARAVSDARVAFENEQDEVAFQMVALAENRKKQAQDILEKNADLALKMEGVRMQREQFTSQMLTQATNREVAQLELEGKREAAAQTRISRLIALGNEFNEDTAPVFMEAAKGLNWSAGDLKMYVETVKKTDEIKAAREKIGLVKDQAEIDKMRRDAAKDTIEILKQSPPGFPIELPDASYFGVRGGGYVERLNDGTARMVIETDAGEQVIRNLGRIQSKDTEIMYMNGKPMLFDKQSNNFTPLGNESVPADRWEKMIPQGSVWKRPGHPLSHSSQCGAFVNDVAGTKFGDTLENKLSLADESITSENVEIGNIIITNEAAKWGHVAIINNIIDTPQGRMYQLTESNYKKNVDGIGIVTHDRTIRAEASAIKGYARGKLHPSLGTGPDALPVGAPEIETAAQYTRRQERITELERKREEQYDRELPSQEIERLNKFLPEESKLAFGATRRDAMALGIKPGMLPGRKEQTFEEFSALRNEELSRLPGFSEGAVERGMIERRNAQLKQEWDELQQYKNTKKKEIDSTARLVKKDIRDETRMQLDEALADNDIDEFNRIVKSSVLNSLDGVQEKFFTTRESITVNYDFIANRLSTYTNKLMSGPYKKVIEKNKPFIGAKGDENFAAFQQLIGAAQAEYMNALLGAALTPQELERANTYLIDVTKDSTNVIDRKLKNGARLMQFANDSVVAAKLGRDRPRLEDYGIKF